MAEVAWQIPLQAGRDLPTFGPTPQDRNQMLQALLLRQKLTQAQQQQNSNAAIGKLFADPNNRLPNGMLKQDVLANAIGSGQVQPSVGIPLIGEAAEFAGKEQRSRVAQLDAQQKEGLYVTDNLSIPAKAEYDRVLKESGGSVELANQAANKVYQELFTTISQRVSPETRAMMDKYPNFDNNRVSSTIMGATGLRKKLEQVDEFTTKTDYGKPQPVEYRQYKDGRTTDIAGNAPYTPTGIGEPKGAEAQLYEGKVDGKPITVRIGPTGGFIDAQTNEPVQNVTGIRKVGTKAEEGIEDAGKPTGPEDLRGEEYLKALPASRASMIKGYAEGRVSFPGSFSLRSPYWQKMVADITQYDPTFDAVNYNSRSATRKDFTSGKSAQNITSFNTAIGHLGSLYKSINKLNNSDFPWWNTASNFANVQGGNTRFQAAKKEFETARTAVTDELTRAFRGTGGNVHDIVEWEKNLSSSSSPTELKTAVKEAVDLLRSRIESVGEQYRRGMGTTADVMDLMTPSAKKTLAALPGGEDVMGAGTAITTPNVASRSGVAPAAEAAIPPASGPAQAAPASQLPPEAAAALKEGQITKFRNGQSWTLRNGKPEQVQ